VAAEKGENVIFLLSRLLERNIWRTERTVRSTIATKNVCLQRDFPSNSAKSNTENFTYHAGHLQPMRAAMHAVVRHRRCESQRRQWAAQGTPAFQQEGYSLLMRVIASRIVAPS
jgi:hypothetical protein